MNIFIFSLLLAVLALLFIEALVQWRTQQSALELIGRQGWSVLAPFLSNIQFLQPTCYRSLPRAAISRFVMSAKVLADKTRASAVRLKPTFHRALPRGAISCNYDVQHEKFLVGESRASTVGLYPYRLA